jgi:cytidylate kinase
MESGLVRDGKLVKEGLMQALDGLDIRFQHDPMTDRSATTLNGRNVEREIRTMAVSNHVTLVSPVPEVRARLVRLQQRMGRGKGVVMDGRDIGTVVFPDAEVKLFMTARPEVRAARRYRELQGKGAQVTLAEVEDNIRQRDLDDTTRAADPLIQAPDAIVIDNSDITAEQQFVKALDIVLEVLARVGQE